MLKRSLSFVLATTLALNTLPTVQGTAQPQITQETQSEIITDDFVFSNGVISHYQGNGGHVIIPSTIEGETVTAIGPGAFRDNPTISKITMADTIETIQYQAFQNCINLTEISFSHRLETIGDGGFYGCTSLKEVSLPYSLRLVGSMVFQECRALTTVTLTSTLDEIGKQMFMDCVSLETILIPEGVKYIGAYGFRGCLKLHTITLPKSLLAVEQSAFQFCPDLAFVHYAEGLSQRNRLYLYPLENDYLLNAEWIYGKQDEISTPEPIYSQELYYSLVRATSVVLYSSEARVGEPLALNFEVSPSDAVYGMVEWRVDNSKALIKDDQFWATESGIYWVECTVTNPYTGQPYVSSGAYIYVLEAENQVETNLDLSLRGASGKVLPTVVQSTPIQSAPYATSNKHRQNYFTQSQAKLSNLVETSSGYRRIEAVPSEGFLVVEDYNTNFQRSAISTVPFELESFVAFYEGERYYYLLFSAENPQESEEKEVLRLVKYDKYWNRIAHCSLQGINTVGDVSQASMAEAGGNLLVQTSHAMYQQEGINPQGNLRFTVDIDSMQLISTAAEISSNSTGYVSQSLHQMVDVSVDGFVVTADHGNAYPRGITIFGWPSNAITTPFGEPTTYLPQMGKVFPIYGLLGNTTTGVRLGGLQVSPLYILSAGTSTPQTAAGIYTSDHNIILNVTNRQDLSQTETKWLTNYQNPNYASNPYLVELNYNSYAILWNEMTAGSSDSQSLCWILIDGAGQQQSEIQKTTGLLSEVEPLVSRTGDIIWYTTDSSAPMFYRLNPSTGAMTATNSATSYTEPLPETPSTSIPNDWAIPFLNSASDMGLLQGVEELTALYQGAITREQFCRLMMNVYRYTGRDFPTDISNPFVDTSHPDILRAYALGIVSGTSQTRFSPQLSITRQELAVMVRSMASLFGDVTVNSMELDFKDSELVDVWARESVAYAQQEGYLAGSHGSILPHDNLTNEAAVAVAVRLAQNFK